MGKEMTRSPKRRTTTKSGNSATSRKTATSSRTWNSPPTAAPSFELDGQPPNPLKARYDTLLAAAKDRLHNLLQEPEPKNGLLRARHKQRIAKERKQILNLLELLD